MSQPKSDIWKYFTELPGEDLAKCDLCKKNYVYKQGSTKGLWDHLKSMHKEINCGKNEKTRSSVF